jgi:hypothetical protein
VCCPTSGTATEAVTAALPGVAISKGAVVNPGVIGAAAGLFAVTNIDDIVVLSLFFAQGAGHRGSAARVVAGQYLGFTAILAVAIAAAVGATFLPEYPCPAPLDHQGITGLVTEPAPASGK